MHLLIGRSPLRFKPTLPEYVKTKAMLRLFDLAFQAGITVSFVSSEHLAEAFAEADPDTFAIHMPATDDFSSSDNAEAIAGHEIGHVIIDHYASLALNAFMDEIEEDNADRIGFTLYRLVRRTLEHGNHPVKRSRRPVVEKLPSYAEDDVFSRLVALSRETGIEVVFEEGRTLESAGNPHGHAHDIIRMDRNRVFKDDTEAGVELGKALARILITDHPPALKETLGGGNEELSITVIGIALFGLAEMIELARVERESLFEFAVSAYQTKYGIPYRFPKEVADLF